MVQAMIAIPSWGVVRTAVTEHQARVDLDTWEDCAGRARIGFSRQEGLQFGAAYDSPDFQESVR